MNPDIKEGCILQSYGYQPAIYKHCSYDRRTNKYIQVGWECSKCDYLSLHYITECPNCKHTIITSD